MPGTSVADRTTHAVIPLYSVPKMPCLSLRMASLSLGTRRMYAHVHTNSSTNVQIPSNEYTAMASHTAFQSHQRTIGHV